MTKLVEAQQILWTLMIVLRVILRNFWSAIENQQTEEPFALSNIGWRADSGLPLPLSHCESQLGIDWSLQCERGTSIQGSTFQQSTVIIYFFVYCTSIVMEYNIKYFKRMDILGPREIRFKHVFYFCPNLLFILFSTWMFFFVRGERKSCPVSLRYSPSDYL